MVKQQQLDELAEELTRRLTIPFHSTTTGTIVFRDRLRVTDWAVPLMFDGHVRRDGDALVPTDFVGHVLWPALKATRASRNERPWWSCTLSWGTATALVESLQDDEDHPDDADEGWIIGRDVLLEEPVLIGAAAATRRVA